MTDDKLRAALETEWANGNITFAAYDRLAALAASATDEGTECPVCGGVPSETGMHVARPAAYEGPQAEAIAEDNLRLAMDALHRPAVPEALDVDIFRQAAIEAHVWSPDHESGDFPCRYEPCRKRYAALRSKEPA